MEITAYLTAAATSVGVLLVVVLAIAPGLLELWERVADRRSDRRTAHQPAAPVTSVSTVVRLDGQTPEPSTQRHFDRAA